MTKTFLPFNVNDYVRVRLTDRGRQIHRENFRKLNATLVLHADIKYTPPPEDADGWSEWQMWDLMSTFGEHMWLSCEPPFGTDIQVMRG